ncbi:TPA: CS1-pili formation C-terminal domain-containing protein [Klebsiella aerogenes]|uniref:CS1-pili formation C-terminal domain-containing protein n=1 Tax=Klebsiella aerogenes TaxID=548 RepID=UPI0005EF4F5B|nr:CS1-pili formation C-terminal domain-containing protein [Klebsiella aerogenes]KJM41537.1 outer membrane usher protein [Klebsiella aerogenes]OVK41706.1 outer membrane usher protein [Klebsiella aerogenes]HBV9807044.1 fimbrial biogenesis outer membrane usher protein [Klebsiella aerogenes]HBY7770349.1 CS1-pili formation C-terminal domain-containing protein [Klebsiella aerogenes]
MSQCIALKLTAAAVFVAYTLGIAHAETSSLQDVRLGKYIIPGVFGQALQQGMTIPIFLRFKGAEEGQNQKIAEGTVVLDGNNLIIKEITILEQLDGAKLSVQTQMLLKSLKNRRFTDGTSISISHDAELNLNIRSFFLTLDVNQKSLATSIIPRSSLLGESSVQQGTSVLNYDLGVYRSQIKNGDNTSNSYLNIDDTLSIAEHHFNINGSFYGIGDSQRDSQLYRAMYEHDFHGRRFAAGLLDTWNLQSLGSMSALNSSKVYGATYGTKSLTQVVNNQYSLTPITVFLPAAGEVHIYRQGRLLNIQNFPMGSFEVDTSGLPYGIYNVQVDVVIDGKVISHMTQTINKSFSSRTQNMQHWDWQIYAGTVDYQDRKYTAESEETNHSPDSYQTWLAGFSTSVSYPVLSGLTLQTSTYSFDSNYINESSLNLTILKYGSIGWQGLISQGGVHRNIINATMQLPEGFGSVWVNREKSHINDKLPIYETNNYSFGGTLNFNQIIDHAGQVTVSHTVDKRVRSNSNNFEYTTSLFSGRWGNVNLRAGIQRYQYDYQSNSSNQRYISLDFSLPLATWLSTGMSSNNGNIKANLTATKNFEDSAFSSAGLNLSKLLKDKKNGESDYSISGYTAFDTKYSSGTLSLSRPDSERLNGNVTARGSVAYSSRNIAASGIQEKSGVIINTEVSDDAVLAAQVNGRHYRLSGSNNFIPLPPYSDYKVELMNDKNSQDSFDIVTERIKNFTLYPGNVALYTPQIKQMITVFGRMTTQDGKPIPNASVRNHIGHTYTDGDGKFSMDVDKRFPVVSLAMHDNAICESELDLRKARGVKWVGNVICEKQTTLAQR